MRIPGRTERERPEFVPVKDCTCDLFNYGGVEYIGKQPDCPKHGFEAVLKAKGPYVVQDEGDNPPIDMK
jgi:hypothetical protein